MKLLVITCLKEDLVEVSRIFKQGKIDVYSTSDIVGRRDGETHNIMADWFVSGGEEVDSIMIFSFTTEVKAVKSLQLIKEFNKATMPAFPLRAFVMSVDQSV